MLRNKNKGILFWMTGLPGAGKTSLANIIIRPLNKKFGNTVLFNGDDIRSIFDLTDYSSQGRKKIGMLKLRVKENDLKIERTERNLKNFKTLD